MHSQTRPDRGNAIHTPFPISSQESPGQVKSKNADNAKLG